MDSEDIAVVNELYETLSWQDGEIARLRAQVEQLTADALVRANKQVILVIALKRIIVHRAYDDTVYAIASDALTAIREPQP